jgi:hypothetical protein
MDVERKTDHTNLISLSQCVANAPKNQTWFAFRVLLWPTMLLGAVRHLWTIINISICCSWILHQVSLAFSLHAKFSVAHVHGMLCLLQAIRMTHDRIRKLSQGDYLMAAFKKLHQHHRIIA